LTATDPDLVNRQLQRLARERHGYNTQALQVLYAIEGFLRRLSLSGYRQQLVLKGAMLLAVLDARRVTKDADLSAHGIPNDEQSVARVVAEIAKTALPKSDGIVFDPASITTEAMREAANYRGVRAKLPAAIGVARVVVALDFSFGIRSCRSPRRLWSYPTDSAATTRCASGRLSRWLSPTAGPISLRTSSRSSIRSFVTMQARCLHGNRRHAGGPDTRQRYASLTSAHTAVHVGRDADRELRTARDLRRTTHRRHRPPAALGRFAAVGSLSFELENLRGLVGRA
jgi:hypothetical protein